MKKKKFASKALIHIICILLSCTFVIPFIYIVSISLTNEDALIKEGYKIFPSVFDTLAYKIAFRNPKGLLYAYRTTIIESVAGTVLGLLVMSLLAYPLSRKNYRLRKVLSFFVYFTTLFGGGLVPTYILNTQYLHMGNTIWIYIFPMIVNAFNVIIIRTSFQNLPESLMESAKLDGCGETGILFKIVFPLSKPILATVGLLTLLARWNDWNTSLLYVRDEELYTLQYMLQRILREVDFINSMAMNDLPGNINNMQTLPSETLRFAMCVLAAGPMLIIFPFFQKYFARGLTVGAVKG